MTNTYSITRAQANLPGIVREAQEAPVVITRHDETVAYVISRRRMEAIRETLEILADPSAMQAIRNAREKKTKYVSLHEIDQD